MKTTKITVGAMGLLSLALMAGNGYSAPAPAEEAAGKPPAGIGGAAANPEQRKIVEGEGWQGFRVGATREELIKDLGQPDANSDKRWLKWRKYFIHCLIDEAQGAFELRFDEGFQGSTTSGIRIGSPLKAALAAYGEPSSLKDNGVGKKLIWSSKGILIWFSGDKATQIVVFRKM